MAATGEVTRYTRAGNDQRGSGRRCVHGPRRGDAAVGLIVFILLASASIGIPVVAYLAGGAKAETMLEGWKTWLGENNATVMAVLFVVFGVVLISQGLGGLSD